MARKQYANPTRRSRLRKERFIRWQRRMAKVMAAVVVEFRLWMAIGAGVVIVAVASILLFAPFFDVREMRIKRQDPRIDPEEVQQVLSPLFKQRLVLVTRSQVESMLQAEYPDIERVEIDKQYPSTLSVALYLEPVIAAIKVAENDDKIEQTGSGSALATDTGASLYSYISRSGYFETSPIRLVSEKLPVLTITDWGIRPQNRTLLLEPETLRTIFQARDTLRRDFGLETTNITVFLRAQEFHIRTNKSTLWFDLRSPLPVQLQRFREFLKAVPLDQAKGYVDLRIADKIIYK